jgi:predicted DNA-binding transcriptional regulator AlpA
MVKRVTVRSVSLMTDRSVMARLGLSRSAFYRYLQSGVLTKPIGRLGKNRRGWTEQDVSLARLELEAPQKKAAV